MEFVSFVNSGASQEAQTEEFGLEALCSSNSVGAGGAVGKRSNLQFTVQIPDSHGELVFFLYTLIVHRKDGEEDYGKL
jgi:hypothetical protein